MRASSARSPGMPLLPPWGEPERGGGTHPAAGEAGKANCPVESEDEEGKAAGAADGVKAGDYEVGGNAMMLSGHSTSNPDAINYFSIKSSEKSGWMPLEDFYSSRYTKNPKIKFTYEQISKFRYMYRSTEYKYSRL